MLLLFSMVSIKFFMNGCFVYKYKVVCISFFCESDWRMFSDRPRKWWYAACVGFGRKLFDFCLVCLQASSPWLVWWQVKGADQCFSVGRSVCIESQP